MPRRAKVLIRNPRRRFLFILARDLGKTVEEIDALVSPDEFNEWIAFYEIDGTKQSAIAKGDDPRAAEEKLRAIEDIRSLKSRQVNK